MISYDKYIVAFSGGKDSIASFLHLLDIGIPVEKIELWHHDIDGKSSIFMDWECTPAYCRAFAAAFNVPIYFSWKEGGFRREMLRNGTRTAPTHFEMPIPGIGIKSVSTGGTKGPGGTRMKFPQVTSDLSIRWCSAYLKIDIMATAIRNQSRFCNSRTLVISGERGEESPARAKYKDFEPDRSDARTGRLKRHVDRWRPVKDWLEKQVWEIIEKYKVRAHPAYFLGWGRVSCKFCIFGNANQFASAFAISPEQGEEIFNYEKQFGCTIKRKENIKELASKGEPYGAMTKELILIATADYYDLNIIMTNWILPAGAYGESCGPI